MFEVGFWELVLVGVVALVVVGPERLPELARSAGRWLGAARRMASTFKSDLEREMRAGELKKMLEKHGEFRGAYDVLEQTKKQLQEEFQGTVDKLNAPVDIPTISLEGTDTAAAAPAAPATPVPATPAPAPSGTGETPPDSAAHGPDGPARA